MNILKEFVKILELKRYCKQTINSYKGYLIFTKNYFNHKSFKAILKPYPFWIHIKRTKGKKDRYTILSNKVLLLLRDYYLEYQPKINKPATLHRLRHSFDLHTYQKTPSKTERVH
jgi:site-specific recombinase XerD